MKGAKKIMKIRIHNLVYGMPITFLNKYRPEQFEFVGLVPERISKYTSETIPNKFLKVLYARILIRKKAGV